MNAVAKVEAATELKPVEVVRQQFEQMTPQLAMALPAHVSPEKFKRVVMTAIQGNPKLVMADRQSLFSSAMKCAQDGLLPNGQEAALVIFRTKGAGGWVDAVQYMPMIAGILSKVRRSGELASITAHIVYANDRFDYTLGDDERIDHHPTLDGDPGPPKAAYAIAKTKDGGIYREIMSVREIERVRAVSRAKDSGPWVDWWSEMARKTVLRRLSKRLPMSTDLQATIERVDELYDLRAREQQGPAPADTLREEAAAPAAKLQVIAPPEPVDVEPTDALQTQPDLEPARDGEEGAAASASDHEERVIADLLQDLGVQGSALKIKTWLDRHRDQLATLADRGDRVMAVANARLAEFDERKRSAG